MEVLEVSLEALVQHAKSMEKARLNDECRKLDLLHDVQSKISRKVTSPPLSEECRKLDLRSWFSDQCCKLGEYSPTPPSPWIVP